MARQGAGKVRRIEKVPQDQGRPTLPPDPAGNREQRRAAAMLERQGRTVEQRPATADAMVERILAMPDWRSVDVKELGRRIGVHPDRARTIRRLIAADTDKPRKKR